MSKKTVNVKVAFLGDPKIGKSEFIKNYAGEKSIIMIIKMIFYLKKMRLNFK